MFDVISYPEDGRALIVDLIADIKKSGNQKYYKDFRKYMDKLSEHGFDINTEFKAEAMKKLEDDMYELRPDNFRILFTNKDGVFYILNGFFKKSQKTPKTKKDIARKYIKQIHDR
jgi:phage-related protein